ncbi:triacylglycerol lipase [Entomortierella parvispora]|uniref:Triacylglycerol lipase n=1 Tax=Entomortierella parvispora TaxID=205924 RepID=A0A9P3H1L4_9FUNG|nr:triacylglycerol lipase [Entomortierella parvispora]
MHFSKTVLSVAAVTLTSIFSTLIQGSPIPTRDEAALTPTLAKRSSSGFNDWNCKPTAQRPLPVVLVHGLTGNAITNWFYMAPRFVAEGYCVFALSYGQLNNVPIIYGLDKMENSAQQLSDFVDKVLASTGTSKVNIFGLSEGSLMPRHYLRFLGGAAKVNKFAGASSIQYGTDLLGLVNILEPLGLYDPIAAVISPFCLSCTQLIRNSTFLQKLNAGGDTVPGVDYLMIASKYDEIVTPYTSGFLKDKNPLVHNQLLQDWCPFDVSDHLLQGVNPIVFNGVHAFFTPSADQNISCGDLLQK